MSSARTIRRAAARALIANPPALPAWMLDQIEAASAERRGHDLEVQRRLIGGFGFRPLIAAPDDDLRADLVAAMWRCKRCPHLGGGPQPAWCRLGHDTVLCATCAVHLTPAPPANDDRCDLCERHECDVFTEILIRVGHVALSLNVADCCAPRFGLGANA